MADRAEARAERDGGLPAEPDRELLLVRLQVAVSPVPRGTARVRRDGRTMSTRVAPAEITAAMGAEPTDEQWAAISWPLEPCVLIAGAGSGKTSVIAARVVYLALGALGRVDAPGVMPGNVLCLTFTNKATENLRLRVRRALAHLELAEGEEPEIMNYHGFAASLLDRYGVLAGFEPGARVLNQAQREELCGRVLDRMTFEHAAATYQPSLVSKILDLSHQLRKLPFAPAEAPPCLSSL